MLYSFVGKGYGLPLMSLDPVPTLHRTAKSLIRQVKFGSKPCAHTWLCKVSPQTTLDAETLPTAGGTLVPDGWSVFTG